jgi:hypothetical protein
MDTFEGGRWVGNLGGLICWLFQMGFALVLPEIANSLDPRYITGGFTRDNQSAMGAMAGTPSRHKGGQLRANSSAAANYCRGSANAVIRSGC